MTTETIEKRDPVVERVRALLLQRSQVGVKKYGTTLADNPLTHKQWLQHGLEEALDLSNYLMAAIMQLESQEAA